MYKLVNMQAKTEKDRDEALARLREKAGEAALLRKQVSDLELSVRSKDRANEDLRRQIPVGARAR
ncbi:defense against restriction protein A [Pseudomonas phage PseuP_224]|nr:defense against restriction protein A [Pseudomonas phage PseuP_224]